MSLRLDVLDALQAEAEALEAYTAARRTRVEAVNAANVERVGTVGKKPHLVENERIDVEMGTIALSGGAKGFLEMNAVRSGRFDGFVDWAADRSSIVAWPVNTYVQRRSTSTGAPDSSGALVTRWTQLLADAGVPAA